MNETGIFGAGFVRKFIFSLLVFLLLYLAAVIFGRFYYLEKFEFPMWRSKFVNLLKTEIPDGIDIILGDSSVSISVIPEMIGENFYNFALGGATAIEMNFLTKKILKSANVKTALIVFTPFHLEYLDAFWSRSLQFRLYNLKEYINLYSEITKLGSYRYPMAKSRLQFQRRFFGYLLGDPKYYKFGFKKWINNEIEYDLQTFHNVTRISLKNRGWFQPSVGTSFAGTSAESHRDELKVYPLVDLYLRKMIKQLTDSGAKVIIMNPPFNPMAHDTIRAAFKKNFAAYLQTLKKEFPQISVNSEFLRYERDHFGDAVHLNLKGARQFSRHIKNKYFSSH